MILTGASLCFLLLNVMRWLDARRLSRIPFRDHVALILALQDAKKLGQRSSNPDEASARPLLVGQP